MVGLTCTYNYPYPPNDESKIDWAVIRVRRGDFDAITMECFNRAEADSMIEYVERYYPGICAACTWLAPSPSGWVYTSAWKHKARIQP